ncbi:MAG: DUF4256 domain-containing protein [Hyphomicrobiales bacterium]
MAAKSGLNDTARASLLRALQSRFEKHPERHRGNAWSAVEARLAATPGMFSVLASMEETGGAPDVTGQNASGAFIFCDCSPESPEGRRGLCFDRAALDGRKENKPAGNVLDMAAEMGVRLLNEDDYRALQRFGPFDLKTSSWISTPPAIRKLGGALFCDRRYDTVFTYHNGASSYYAARGFRGRVLV